MITETSADRITMQCEAIRSLPRNDDVETLERVLLPGHQCETPLECTLADAGPLNQYVAVDPAIAMADGFSLRRELRCEINYSALI